MSERSAWILCYDGFEPAQEKLREALCTLGNGKFATRGAAEEVGVERTHYPGTYVAGGYNRLESEISGHAVTNEDLVNFPDWLPITFRPVDGPWLNYKTFQMLTYRQQLHMQDGILHRLVRWRDPDGRETTVATQRLVHMLKAHYAALSYSITPENWTGPVHIRSWLNAGVSNSGVERYRQLNAKHLIIDRMGGVAPAGVYVVVRTSQSHIEVAIAARTRIFNEDCLLDPESRSIQREITIGEEFTLDAEAGKTLRIEKVCALYTIRDRGITEPGLDARLALTRTGNFAELRRTHRLAWKTLWRRCDIVLASKEQERIGYVHEEMILRLHILHLLQTVSLNSIGLDVGVPARGLHGEAYRGHVFWDELFILPFYNLQLPEVTRSILLYRYNRLDAARALAAEAGYRGAMYPWQSSSDGREETQRLHLNPLSGRWDPDHSSLQRHISAAIAFNVWSYYHATGDVAFLEQYGAEILLEIARFWSSLATWNETTQRYEIHGVMGPDEYHEKYPGAIEGGLRNNAYTNVMAVWCLDRARDVLSLIHSDRNLELCSLLGIEPDEIKRWEHIGQRMTIVFHSDGIISQFEGYEHLKEFDWEGYKDKYGNIERLDRILKAEGDSPDHYKASKQADLCMLFYLLTPKELQDIFERLGYPFHEQTIAENIFYYMARTSHGSTLSKVVYASLLDRIDRHVGFELFREALRSDIDDIQGGTTAEGIHLGAMAGTVDIVLRHFAGIDTTGDEIAFAPSLPDALPGLHFRIQFRGTWMEIDVSKTTFCLALDQDGRQAVPITVYGQRYKIVPGTQQSFEVRPQK
jgi:alpha,alpha-trehalase